MDYPKYVRLAFFGRGRLSDPHYLAAWQSAPLTYNKEQELDQNWNFDHYEVVLGNDTDGALFKHASVLALSGQLLPASVAITSSNFSLEQRAIQAGDRVLLRIRLFEIAGRPILEALTMNEVTKIVQEENQVEVTYTTTAVHSIIGEWTIGVERRDLDEVVLVMSAISRDRPGMPKLLRCYNRRMQLRGHQLSIAHFRKLLNVESQSNSRRNIAIEALPAALFTLALLFLTAAALDIYHKAHCQLDEAGSPGSAAGQIKTR